MLRSTHDCIIHRKHLCHSRMARWWRHGAFFLVLLGLLVACQGADDQPAATPTTSNPEPEASAVPATAVPEESAAEGVEAVPARTYQRFPAPLIPRSETAAATLSVTDAGTVEGETGEFRIAFGEGALADAIVVSREGQPTGMALRPLGPELNLLANATAVEMLDEEGETGVRLAGTGPWGPFELRLWVYPNNPGLLRYRVDVEPTDAVPNGATALEWQFVDPTTGEEAPADLTNLAERATFAAPAFYSYAAAMDATLLYWLDLTSLNPFIEATRYGPSNTAGRQGRTFGHNLTPSDLRDLQPGNAVTLYDSYIYLAPAEPADEPAMFLRYLQQVGDIYDLLNKPEAVLPDWQTLGAQTLTDLDDPDTWVELNGKRYWRAYVADTRQSAEAITQLDVGLGAARYAARYDDEQARHIADLAEATLEDFYNPRFGLVQNSGPLAVSGDQGRGDTWYELGHVLKLAEWGLLGSEVAADLALRSAPAWMEYGHAVEYSFHQFYNFPNPDNPEQAWQGSGREPDSAGGYAYYMLLLHELTGDAQYLDEAVAAVETLQGHGFLLAYETHSTAQSAAALARLWQITGETRYLDLSYAAVANLVRLSWVWEMDYGPAADAVTFWGLNPTQASGVITPKEQYEVWIYLDEYLRLTHGTIDASAEKLVAEFLKYSLVTASYSLPPLAPFPNVSDTPSAYTTVAANRLDLTIPLEDVRDSWGTWGTIGQEVYGAGLAPTFAALAYDEVAPGVTVYSGYPPVAVEGESFTLAGPTGYGTPLQLSGATLGEDDGQPCGEALCYTVGGGEAVTFGPR